MKIIFDFQDMSGGAPNSQFAHMMLMHKKGHTVIATIGRNHEMLSKKINPIKIIGIKNFNLNNPINSFKSIFDWIHIIKKEKPDIIHSNRPVQNRMLAIVSRLTGIPLVFAQAGGKVKYAEVLPLLGYTAIVYSKENYAAFLKAGFKKADINLISNRLPSIVQNNLNASQRANELKIILTGNIKDDTIKGIRFFLNLLQDNITNIQKPIIVYLAGKDISENKVYDKEIKAKIENINNCLPAHSKIHYLGWVDDITKIQLESDICIGKGRSVLQPAMEGKISYVISEKGLLTRIKKSTFDQLYYFNFSGRGFQENNADEFVKLLVDRSLIQSLAHESFEAKEQINKVYNISFAYEKLLKTYKKALEKNNKNEEGRHLHALNLIIKIYYLKLKHNNKQVEIQ